MLFQSPKFAVQQFEPPVCRKLRVQLRYRLRVAIYCQQAPRRTQSAEDRAAVPPAAERAIYVAAARLDVQPLEHWCQQDRYVLFLVHLSRC